MEVNEVVVSDGERRQRFAVCHNPEAEEPDRQARANLVASLETQLCGADERTRSRHEELAGKPRATPAF